MKMTTSIISYSNFSFRESFKMENIVHKLSKNRITQLKKGDQNKSQALQFPPIQYQIEKTNFLFIKGIIYISFIINILMKVQSEPLNKNF